MSASAEQAPQQALRRSRRGCLADSGIDVRANDPSPRTAALQRVEITF
jgi:hypothetical protein